MFEYRMKLLRVIDGDTIEVEVDLGFHVRKTETVRLARIDVPEPNDPDPTQRGRSVAAKSRVGVLLGGVELKGSTMKPYPKDKYGRWLAEISFQDASGPQNVSDILLNEGLADLYGAKKP